MNSRPIIALVLLIGLSMALYGQSRADLPYRNELRHDIRFWKRVFHDLSLNQQIFHDSDYLQVAYRTVTFDTSLSRSAVEKEIEAIKDEIKTVLRRFVQDPADTLALSAYEQHIYDQFRSIKEKDKFRKAIKRVRAQQGIRENFMAGVMRSYLYLPHIRKQFIAEGLPAELAYLPHVESSFNSAAVSHVGAAGMWQFMPRTARSYMKVNKIKDERFDPLIATWAASRLLRWNQKVIKDWALAITAYNHGLGGMRRAKRRVGGDYMDIREKYLRRSFGFASKNFYPEFLAVIELSDSLEAEHALLPKDQLPDFHDVVLPMPINLKTFAREQQFDPQEFRLLNPGYRKTAWDGKLEVPAGYKIRFPYYADKDAIITSMELKLLAKGDPALAQAIKDRLLLSDPPPVELSRGEVLAARQGYRTGGSGIYFQPTSQHLRLPDEMETPELESLPAEFLYAGNSDQQLYQPAAFLLTDRLEKVRSAGSDERLAWEAAGREEVIPQLAAAGDVVELPAAPQKRLDGSMADFELTTRLVLRQRPPGDDLFAGIRVTDVEPMRQSAQWDVTTMVYEESILSEPGGDHSENSRVGRPASTISEPEIELIELSSLSNLAGTAIDRSNTLRADPLRPGAYFDLNFPEKMEQRIIWQLATGYPSSEMDTIEQSLAGINPDEMLTDPSLAITQFSLVPSREDEQESQNGRQSDTPESHKEDRLGSSSFIPSTGLAASAISREAGTVTEQEVFRLLSERLIPTNNQIVIFPEETLGHFAQWLGIGIREIRAANGLGRRQKLIVGQSLKLLFYNVSIGDFVEKRRRFHMKILQRHLNLNGSIRLANHVIQPGESLWSLARKRNNFPVNLLLYFNDLNKLDRLYPGDEIKLPIK